MAYIASDIFSTLNTSAKFNTFLQLRILNIQPSEVRLLYVLDSCLGAEVLVWPLIQRGRSYAVWQSSVKPFVK